jgi:hypothetical protein
MTDLFALERHPSASEEAQTRGQGSHAGPPRALPATLPVEYADDAEAAATLRPGQGYRIQRSGDRRGTLPEDYERVLRRAERWTGVEANEVCVVIERFERRLVRWWEAAQRKRAGDENR